MQKYIINHLLVCRIKIFILLLTPSQNSVAGNRLLVFFVDANDFKFVSGIQSRLIGWLQWWYICLSDCTVEESWFRAVWGGGGRGGGTQYKPVWVLNHVFLHTEKNWYIYRLPLPPSLNSTVRCPTCKSTAMLLLQLSPHLYIQTPLIYIYIYILLYNHLHILYIYHIYSYSYVSSSSSIAPLGGQAAVACRMCWCGGACPLFLYYLSAPPAAAAATVPCKACFDQIFCFLRNNFV